MLSRFWWGWVFLINVRVVVIGLAMATVLVPESRSAEPPQLDLTGATCSTLGLVVVTHGLVQAGQDGWGSGAPARHVTPTCAPGSSPTMAQSAASSNAG